MNTINYSRKTTLDDSIMFATNQIRVCFERALYKRINDSATIKDPRTSYLDKIPVEILGRTNIEQIEYVAQVLQST